MIVFVLIAVVPIVLLAIGEAVEALIDVVLGFRRTRVRRRAELDITPAVARCRRPR